MKRPSVKERVAALLAARALRQLGRPVYVKPPRKFSNVRYRVMVYVPPGDTLLIGPDMIPGRYCVLTVNRTLGHARRMAANCPPEWMACVVEEDAVCPGS